MRRLAFIVLAAMSQVAASQTTTRNLSQPIRAQPAAEASPVNSADHEQWVSLVDGFEPGSPPELSVLESTTDRTVVHVVLPGFWVESCPLDGVVYQKLTIPDAAFTCDIGRPQLPVIHALVAIPFDAQPTVSVCSASPTTLAGYRVYPCQPPVFDDGVARARPALDPSAGQERTLPSAQVASLGAPGVWRDLNVVRVDLFMVQYDRSVNNLIVHNDVTVDIEHPSSRGLLQDTSRAISPEFETIYRTQVLNDGFLDALARGQRGRSGPQYLIITHPNFAAAIQPLAEWHQRAGMDTEVVSITTTDPQVVKNTIVNRYSQGGLEYVLLVGDPGYIPISTWDGIASDYWYACLTGSPPDLYADIALGRLSVTSSTQVEHQVAKTLTYLTDPPLSTSWLTTTLLVAHKTAGVYQYKECKEYIRTSLLPGTGFTASTAYGETAGVNDALVTARINSGQGIVNYRGHGLASLWWQWNLVPEDWSTTNVYALNNGDYTPVVFNIACENHRIEEAAESLGEAWLNKYPGGAVASLGATDDGYTYANQDYDKELYNQFCRRGEYHLGWMSNAAATYILAHDPSYAPWNVKMFLWLGDPALELWTNMPAVLSVAHPDTVLVRSSELSVSVSAAGAPVDGALVCLWKEDEVYDTQITANGIATFAIAPATAGPLAVTVTKHNYLPYEADVTVLDLVLADINDDGLVNGFDIDPFVSAITLSEAEFVAQHPTWHYWAADCNQDGVVNAFDIDPFVALLTGG